MKTYSPDTLAPRTLWSDRAICADLNPTVMEPADEDEKAIAYARSICGRCPVAAECLNAALREERAADRYMRDGMRGGLTPAERCTEYRRRQRARLKQKQQPAPTPPPPPADCGTRRGYDRHRRDGEDPCQKCRAGVAAEQRERRRLKAAHLCGTRRGHAAHIRRGEAPCDACAATQPDSSRKAAA